MACSVMGCMSSANSRQRRSSFNVQLYPEHAGGSLRIVSYEQAVLAELDANDTKHCLSRQADALSLPAAAHSPTS